MRVPDYYVGTPDVPLSELEKDDAWSLFCDLVCSGEHVLHAIDLIVNKYDWSNTDSIRESLEESIDDALSWRDRT